MSTVGDMALLDAALPPTTVVYRQVKLDSQFFCQLRLAYLVFLSCTATSSYCCKNIQLTCRCRVPGKSRCTESMSLQRYSACLSVASALELVQG